MDHHILRPTLEHLKDNTLDLSNLVAGVVQLFDNAEVGATDLGQARCAAKVYLAIVYAFEKKGFTQVAHAPDLWLDIGTGVYEISLAGPDQSSAHSLSLGTKIGNSQDQALESAAHRHPRHQHLIQELEGLDLSKLDAREPAGAADSSDVRMQCSGYLGRVVSRQGEDTLQNLKDCLSRLGSLQALQFRTSVTINWEYWRLGECYARFCEANALPGREWFAKDEQARIFKIVTLEWAMDARAGQAVRKRLQRARKFVLLVRKFGTVVLNAVPQVSVSKVDRVRLDDF